MERIWLKSYPPGVPADIDPSEFKSLVEVFDRKGVTFVSVTQSFNTTTSMGRLGRTASGPPVAPAVSMAVLPSQRAMRY